MAYCTNCGAQQIENAKFCHNCGNNNDKNLAEVSNEIPKNNQNILNQDDLKDIDIFEFEPYFREISNSGILFLWDNLPEHLETFKSFFNPELFNNSKVYVYYDDSDIGEIEDVGFVILLNEDSLFILFKTSEENMFGAYLRNIRKVNYVYHKETEMFGIECTIKPSEEDDEKSFIYYPISGFVLKSLFNFLNQNAKNFGINTISEENNALIESMIIKKYFEYEDDDEIKSDGAGIR